MGLIKAAKGAVEGALADQWKEYFYCEALPVDVLVVKGQKRASRRSSNTKGSENIITSGSVIAVAAGQCMMIVDQGKVAEVCADPGEFIYDASTEPTIFSGELEESIRRTFESIGRRFTSGGEPPKDQRVYYFNTKELPGNKYGTPSPVPFRVVDRNIGLDMDIAIRCFGEYSYRICDPMLFYTNVCGNVESSYTRQSIDGQLKSELMTALQPAFARISEMGVRYSALPGHTMELAQALNEVLGGKWRKLRGLEIVSFGVSSVKASEEDERMIKELQRNAVFRDPAMAAAQLTGAQAAAMQSAAANTSTGASMAFMGMNMAGAAGGMNVQELFRMAQESAPGGGWTCQCGAKATGKFCPECGRPKPAQDGWTCICGAVNKGKFCAECGKPKPAGVPQYKCDKCGWEPADKTRPPKFCPECGDPFDDGDLQ
ncbi:SPFH domain-containing protein [Oscillibacter sp.]|uniref:SPFH domain-containing protein n=1 Tax=Oscillibacter sp. TaxID=1945593 RepID=UPI0028A5C5E8|nr:SPFH domain-containing protein [Oscillibacter sp.]